MPRHIGAPGVARRRAALLLLATVLAAACREQPTAPGQNHTLSGRVRLTGYLVDARGVFAGTRVVDDVDGLDVELRHGSSFSRHAKTVAGGYRFDGLGPGLYTVRAQVIGDIFDETRDLTIVDHDVVSGDTIQLKSFGDIFPIPNPGYSYTDLWYAIPDSEHVDLRVRDMQGNTTQIVVSKDLPTGIQRAYWNWRDQSGRLVSGSLYWVTFESGSDMRAQLLFR
jgi:hypothetical protein